MVPASSTAKSERLAARVTPKQKELFQRAADLTGRTLTDFIISSAEAAAEEAVRTRQVIELTTEDTKVLVAALLNPPKPNERLRAAARSYRELVDRE